jgi:hypothetical protein
MSRQGAGPLVDGGGAMGPRRCMWGAGPIRWYGGPHGFRGAPAPPAPAYSVGGPPGGATKPPLTKFSREKIPDDPFPLSARHTHFLHDPRERRGPGCTKISREIFGTTG